MIDRWSRLLLSVALLVSSLGAIAYGVWILFGLIVSTRWYWGGAIAAYIGPLSFAAAAYLNELRIRLAPRRDDLMGSANA